MKCITQIKEKVKQIKQGINHRAEHLNDVYEDEKASAGVMSAVLTVVAGAVTMGVGAMVLAKIEPSVVGSSTQSNTTIASIFSTAWDAFGLLPIVLVVIAAVVIIGAVMMLNRGN